MVELILSHYLAPVVRQYELGLGLYTVSTWT